MWIRVLSVVLGILCFLTPIPSFANSPQFLEVTIPVYVPPDDAARRPPVATYVWGTLSGASDPAEVRHIMVYVGGFNDPWADAVDYILNNPNAPEWSAWEVYNPPSIGTSWVSPTLAYGSWIFAVQGRDSDGNTCYEFSLDRNMRRVFVQTRTTGPVLYLTGPGLDGPNPGLPGGPILTSSPESPPRDIEVPGGTPIEFCWWVDASDYGGVASYRYGWDIVDPEDDNDSGWVTDWIPAAPQVLVCALPQVFHFGTHVFTLQAQDNDGYRSRGQVNIGILPTTPVEAATWGAVKALFR